MSFLLYLVIIASIFTLVMGALGSDIKITLPVLIGLAIIIAIIRALLIKKKNSY